MPWACACTPGLQCSRPRAKSQFMTRHDACRAPNGWSELNLGQTDVDCRSGPCNEAVLCCDGSDQLLQRKRVERRFALSNQMCF